MSDNFYGRNDKEDSTYSYSYVNSSNPVENPNLTTGYVNPVQNNREEIPKKKKHGFLKTCMKAACIALIFGMIVSGCFIGAVKIFNIDFGGDAQNAGPITTYSSDLVSSVEKNGTKGYSVTDITKAAMPSVVAITNTAEMKIQSFFGYQTQEVQSAGSGIIVAQDDKKLYIVTNNHVVESSKELSVTFVDNETVKAEVRGTATGMDLAVITVDIKDIQDSTMQAIKVAVLGDSSACEVGQQVIAIGNALGYGQSVTVGYISALNRSIQVEGNTYSLMQVDAAINPGNSGGALLNSLGQVIGINSAKATDTSIEGVGFAIPISSAKPFIDSIISRDEISADERGYIGIYGENVTEDIASVYNLPVGVYITKLVNGGAAEEAGMHVSDIITEIDGMSVKTMSEIQSLLQFYRKGTEVKVKAMVNDGGAYVEKLYTLTLKEYIK